MEINSPRIYRELELNLKIKPRKSIKRDKPKALSVPTSINQTWSMDFTPLKGVLNRVSDSLTDDRAIRAFNVVDDYNREGISIDVDLSLPARWVIQSLERLTQALRDWAQGSDIELKYIQPDKPTQNTYVERFNLIIIFTNKTIKIYYLYI